jgi:hypothetical protein
VDTANLLVNVVGTDIIPDLSIGRMPVRTVEELENIIEKIISFESQPFQDWKLNLVFVADNVPDYDGDFVSSSNKIIENNIIPDYRSTKIYQNDFDCYAASPLPPGCKDVTHALTSTLNYTGALFVNYTGHGATLNWSDEQILKSSHLSTLNNSTKLPISIDMTCLTGYWVHPSKTSIAVNLLKLDNAGAVATFSPTGLGVGLGHDILHAGFYDAMFKSGLYTLGEASIGAKVSLFREGGHFDLIHTYTVFGDPALELPVLRYYLFPILYR